MSPAYNSKNLGRLGKSYTLFSRQLKRKIENCNRFGNICVWLLSILSQLVKSEQWKELLCTVLRKFSDVQPCMYYYYIFSEKTVSLSGLLKIVWSWDWLQVNSVCGRSGARELQNCSMLFLRVFKLGGSGACRKLHIFKCTQKRGKFTMLTMLHQ